MPSIIIYNNKATPAQVQQFIVSVDPASYQGRTDIKVYDDATTPTEESVKSFLLGKSLKYFKVSGNDVVEYTQAEKDALDAAEAANLLAEQRSEAKSFYSSPDALGKIERAVALVLLDEINVLRQRDRDRATDVAAAASLADLKIRWAARSGLPDRTATQARAAIENKIDSGGSD